MNSKTLPAWALDVAPDIVGLRTLISNLYFIGEPNQTTGWTLVDAGMLPSAASKIRTAAEEWFGAGARPAAIVLTHGHFDHIGGLEILAKKWDVPVYAHPLEFGFLRGEAIYPPPDPSVGGGMMARLSPLYPRTGADVSERLHPLPADGTVPNLPDWQWLHTPGHTPGHISLFRPNDRVLIAGDAFVTTKQESAIAVARQAQKVNRPPAYYTVNWERARHSVEILAGIEPAVVATGHGVPMRGEKMREGLQQLAHNFDDSVPDGFYKKHPAMFDESDNLVSEAAPDQKGALLAKLGALAAVLVFLSLKRKSRPKIKKTATIVIEAKDED